MTDIDIEISEELALAIGWEKHQIVRMPNTLLLCEKYKDGSRLAVFDYRDWSVIGPIAEKYNSFPVKLTYVVGWTSKAWDKESLVLFTACADTPQKAIALAVIGANK